MPQSSAKKKVLILIGTVLAIAFLVFTVWIIHEANIGRDNILFKTVRATPYGDKIGHLFLAGALTLVANFLCRNRMLLRNRLTLPLGSLIILVIVILEEASQYYLPLRSLDIKDGIANVLGIAIMSLPAYYFDRRKQLRSAAQNA